MSIDRAAEIAAGQLWRERRTGRVISIIDADSVYAGGGRVRYQDASTGRRNSLLIHALQARFDKVLDAMGKGAEAAKGEAA